MGSCGNDVRRSCLGFFFALSAALFTHNASAALPPTISGSSVPIDIPSIGGEVVVNLRDIGAISGSPPLRVDPQVLDIEVLVNGQSAGGLFIRPVGSVCAVIMNGDFSRPPEGTVIYALTLSVSSASTPAAVSGRVVIADVPGPVVDTDAERAACADPNTPPVANAGQYPPIQDVGAPGEAVLLTGSATDVNPGTVFEYEWSLGGTTLQRGPSPTYTTQPLQPGTYTFSLTVRDDSGDRVTETSQSSNATITVVANAAPTASAGADRTVNDTDGLPGEAVNLTGTATDSDGTIVSFEWFSNDSSLGTGATLQTRLPNGVNQVELVVIDNSQQRASDTVVITVGAPVPPTVQAGEDRTIADTDGEPGEPVTLTGSGNDPDGTIESYEWFLGESSLGTGATLQTRLPDGANQVLLVATDNSEQQASDTVVITVGAPVPPTAQAGVDRTIADTDGELGESVTLTGTGTAPNGTIESYEWFLGESSIGTGATLETRLPDGVNEVQLVVTDDDERRASDTVVITVVGPAAPTANAGADQSVADTDSQAGENVTLDGSASGATGGIASYVWRNAQEQQIATGATANVRLPDGENIITLVVTNNAGASATDTVSITVATAPQTPVANAGPDQTIADTDSQVGETVALNGTASSDPNGDALTYQWTLQAEPAVALGTGPTLNVRLPDGANTVSLRVEDPNGNFAVDTVTVNVTAAPQTPVANAGPDQTLPDTDRQLGETVTLTGTGSSDPNGDTLTYQWTLQAEPVVSLGAGPTLNVRLPDGASTVSLRVEDTNGNFAVDTLTVNVTAAPQIPVASAGPDQTIADTDREPGELVTLSGASSSDPNGETLTYQWSLQADPVVELGSGSTLSVRLPDGTNTVNLRVQDPGGNFAVDTLSVTIAAPIQRVSLAELPNLTPNKRAVAVALDRICVELDDLSRQEAALTEDQSAMNDRCNALYFDNTAANQSEALGALGGDDFAAARTQTLLFSNTLYASVMDRLVALRGGARGLSLAGLNIVVDGQLVPLAQMQDMVKGLLGGGASSDADKVGGLLSDKLGIWMRGNYSTGEKDETLSSPSFDADQWALIGGVDYRLSDRAVVGGSFAYGQSGIEFNPQGEGALDTTSWATSLYGSLYAAKNFYFDMIVNVANSDYDADRNITYVDGSGLVNADASGTTDGMTLSGGLSAGYDFLIGGLTISPTIGTFYIDATIDGFTERGAPGLNLIYDEQNFASLTGNLGMRVTYAWNTSWGVLLPHVRVDYVREFEDDVDVFGIRFAADPNANSTPPILVQTDNPDRSYWRLATGFSAQFARGFSGYVEYQRLESFEFISFEDLSIGLRMQKSF